MTRLRVLLVEDDSTFRRYVAMALEDLPVDLVTAETLAQALEAVEHERFPLLITDLTLPDGDGLDLLERMRTKGLGAGSRIVVMSGTIGPDTRARAEALGAWRVIGKPVPMQVLADCVQLTLQDAPAAAAPSLPSPIPAAFGGNAALFESFRAASLAQFPADLDAGDAACRQRDVAALRRHAHSLKTVLALLGADAASAQARALEVAAAATAADIAALEPLWLALSTSIRALG